MEEVASSLGEDQMVVSSLEEPSYQDGQSHQESLEQIVEGACLEEVEVEVEGNVIFLEAIHQAVWLESM